MSMNLIYGVLLICTGFVCSRLVLNFLKNESETAGQYVFNRDSWLYMFMLMCVGLFSVFFLMPDFNDIIVPIKAVSLWVLLGLSLVIYIAFLMETDWLLYVTVAVSSLILTFMVPNDILLFGGLVSFWIDRLIAAAIIFIFTASAQWFNNLPGIFAIQSLTITIGLCVIAIVGGVSHILGFAGACLAGIWLGYLHLNWFPEWLKINNGACVSAMFIFSGLLLDGALEMAGPSMLILVMYPLTEIIWSLVRRYIFSVKQRDWQDNTAYMSIADKGVMAETVGTAVAKIGLVNVVLACFQLFSVNGFSIPLFAFVADLWLLGMLYNADEKNPSFKEINRDFINNVKGGLKNIKQSVGKGKKR